MLTGRRGRRPLLSAWEGRGERRLASEAQPYDALLSAGSWTRLRVRWGQATHDVSGARRPRPHARNSIVVRMTTLSGPVVAKLPRERYSTLASSITAARPRAASGTRCTCWRVTAGRIRASSPARITSETGVSAATPTSGRFRTNQCAEALGGQQGEEPLFGVNGEERTQVKDGRE